MLLRYAAIYAAATRLRRRDDIATPMMPIRYYDIDVSATPFTPCHDYAMMATY